MKLLGYILLVVLFIGLIIYSRLMIVINKLDFDYKIDNFDMSKINIANFAQNNKLEVDSDMTINLMNKTTFSLKITNIIVNIFYQGTLIAKTLDKNLVLIINPKTNSQLNSKVRVYIDSESLSYITQFLLTKSLDIEYSISGRYLGFIPFSTKGSYSYSVKSLTDLIP